MRLLIINISRPCSTTVPPRSQLTGSHFLAGRPTTLGFSQENNNKREHRGRCCSDFPPLHLPQYRSDMMSHSAAGKNHALKLCPHPSPASQPGFCELREVT